MAARPAVGVDGWHQYVESALGAGSDDVALSDLIGAVGQTTRAVVDAFATLSPDLHRRAAPAAFWDEITTRHPALATYPLGPALRRATKRTVLDLTAEGARTPPKLAAVFGELAAHCYFELCVDWLRRPLDSRDRPPWYLDANGAIPSLAAEGERRARLMEACRLVAAKHSAALPAAPTTSPEQTPLTVVVGGGSLKPKRRRYPDLVERPLRLNLGTDKSNVTFDLDQLEEAAAVPLRSPVRDLMELGVVVHEADLYVRRAKNLSRTLGVLLPMRHADVWDAAKGRVERTVALLGGDQVRVEFPQLGTAPRLPTYDVADDDRCVCLFSGGLDSAAGVLWALDHGLRPTLVSHFSQGQLAGIQNRVAAWLAGVGEVEHVHFFAGKSKVKKGVIHRLGSPAKSVMAQHLRTFMFLAVAAGIALERGIARLYVFENGPTAVNPDFSEGRVNTHTTHPRFLDEFAKLVEEVFGVALRVENPFLYMTKGEIAHWFAPRGRGAILRETVSCFSWFRVPQIAKKIDPAYRGRHCGVCLPCVVRRAAVHAAGLDARDAAYLTDVTRDLAAVRPRHVHAVVEMLRYCQLVAGMNDDRMLRRSPEFSVTGADVPRLMAMYRRHAGEMLELFRDSTPEVSAELAPVLVAA